MVRKVSYILFFVLVLANTFSCQMMNRSRYKNCNDIIITENIFSLIDTTQIYNIEHLNTGYNSGFCKFSSTGKIQFLFLDNENRYKNTPKKYERGSYYIGNRFLILKTFVKYPQGGIRTKKILTAVCDGVLYFRYEDECEKSIRLTPINAKYNQQ